MYSIIELDNKFQQKIRGFYALEEKMGRREGPCRCQCKW